MATIVWQVANQGQHLGAKELLHPLHKRFFHKVDAVIGGANLHVLRAELAEQMAML
jgi:hypothetical protein